MLKFLIFIVFWRLTLCIYNWHQPGYSSHLTYRYPKSTGNKTDWEIPKVPDSFDGGEIIIDVVNGLLLLTVHGKGMVSEDLVLIQLSDGEISDRLELFNDGWVNWREILILAKPLNENDDYVTATSIGWNSVRQPEVTGVVTRNLQYPCEQPWAYLTQDYGHWSWAQVNHPYLNIVIIERDDDDDDYFHVIGIETGEPDPLWDIREKSSFGSFTIDEEGYVYTFANTSILRIESRKGQYQKFPVEFHGQDKGSTYKISAANVGIPQFYFTDDIHVFGIEKGTGNINWKTKIDKEGSFCSPVAINDDHSLVSTACEETVYYIDPKDGKITKQLKIDDTRCHKVQFLYSGRSVVTCMDQGYVVEKDFSFESCYTANWRQMGPLFDIDDCLYNCVYNITTGSTGCYKKCI